MAAPDLHFLTGKPLERLKDAATVTFLSQLTLFSDAQGTVFKRAAERLVVSYDLWEEKFSVTIPGGEQAAASRMLPRRRRSPGVWTTWRSARWAGAGPAVLAALRTAHGGPAGAGERGGRFRAEPQRPDRPVQPEAGRGRILLDANARPVPTAGSAAHAVRPRTNRVNRLRNRLILVFLAATLVPLAATVWITTSLLEWSLNFSTTGELERLSRTLERTGHEFYQRAARRSEAAGATRASCSPQRYPAPDRDAWPAAVKDFAEATERGAVRRRRPRRRPPGLPGAARRRGLAIRRAWATSPWTRCRARSARRANW